MTTRAVLMLVASLALVQPVALAGQDLKPADRGPWEGSVFMGGFDDNFEFDPNGSAFFIDPDGNILYGAALNYHFPLGIYLGGSFRFVPLDMQPPAGGIVDVNSHFFSANLGYTLPLHERFDIYGQAGLTGAYWSPEIGGGETDVGLTYGGGIRLYLRENLALIGDYRMTQIPTAMEDVTQSVAGLTANETFWGYSISGGISYFFGSKDSDGDGVKDGDDACPDTPSNVEVDARGCPVDSDGDGVADYQDNCPDTPAGARVNSQGCPLDGDSDGVFDGLDRCPGTPAGAEVDANGCHIDSDNDGVPNGLDRCPNTARGTEVDRYGCAVPEPEPKPEPKPVTYTFKDVNFEFDSARLTSAGETRLREIGDILVTAEDLWVSVEGHTDSVGDEAYNMTLSRRRAEAVRDFLVEHYSQLNTGQFTVQDFGEARPVADNDTAEGRRTNRRVEIKVGG
jgi:outer membrane protein OmpA-like peptidoglycan-associated protein/opacity protein-like surface antigen